MLQTVATSKVHPQQGPSTPIYMPPARPSGVVRRKRQDHASVRVSAVSPYPDAFSRQTISLNAHASGSTAQEPPWMDSLQRHQRESGEFMPDYRSPGDPTSQRKTSGGKTETANAKNNCNIKGSEADQVSNFLLGAKLPLTFCVFGDRKDWAS
jgi:hypothetical protein